MVLLNWDLLEKITKLFVGVCIEVGYSSCRDLNEMQKVMSSGVNQKENLPLVKCIFEARIDIKTDIVTDQFPG